MEMIGLPKLAVSCLYNWGMGHTDRGVVSAVVQPEVLLFFRAATIFGLKFGGLTPTGLIMDMICIFILKNAMKPEVIIKQFPGGEDLLAYVKKESGGEEGFWAGLILICLKETAKRNPKCTAWFLKKLEQVKKSKICQDVIDLLTNPPKPPASWSPFQKKAKTWVENKPDRCTPWIDLNIFGRRRRLLVGFEVGDDVGLKLEEINNSVTAFEKEVKKLQSALMKLPKRQLTWDMYCRFLFCTADANFVRELTAITIGMENLNLDMKTPDPKRKTESPDVNDRSSKQAKERDALKEFEARQFGDGPKQLFPIPGWDNLDGNDKRREFKKGLSAEKQRRKREDARLTLRKKNREEQLQKRRKQCESDRLGSTQTNVEATGSRKRGRECGEDGNGAPLKKRDCGP